MESLPKAAIQRDMSRRGVLKNVGAVAAFSLLGGRALIGETALPAATGMRPLPEDRRFRSDAVEQFLNQIEKRIGDPEIARLFVNCFPNTLDTTVEPGTFEGEPDTVVITGDIPAMWLRDSSAQVWPYLPLAR